MCTVAKQLNRKLLKIGKLTTIILNRKNYATIIQKYHPAFIVSRKIAF